MNKTALILCLGFVQFACAQTKLDLDLLSDFKPVAANWKKARSVWADIYMKDTLFMEVGTGILVNQPSSTRQDLFTNFTHGDIDIELDYMMAPGSNSGIYLQGRYELQLLDSWTVLNSRASDNGGIYERWDDTKPNGQKGYDGHAPRLNASKAPGTWQHLKISFQAPRFEGNTKVENAKFLRVDLNGVVIHENVELSGPTRGATSLQEVAEDALRIQGDHGTIAFRNIIVNNFKNKKPTLDSIKYHLYKGNYKTEPDFKSMRPIITKPISKLTSTIDGLPVNEFLIRYMGTLHIKEAGLYLFTVNGSGGNTGIRINNNTIIPFKPGTKTGSIELTAGDVPIQILYSKYNAWAKPIITINVKGPGIREFELSREPIPFNNDPDPVLVHATENTVLRSFMDIPNGKRVVHAVNVGTAEKIHYTYDMDFGFIVQVWRGTFLDATPMWHSRGDGSSRPLGVVQHLGKPTFSIQKLNSPTDSWKTDSIESAFRPRGYTLDEKDRPIFHYSIFGTQVRDASSVLDSRHGIQRTISIDQERENLYFKLVSADQIEEKANGLYLINNQSYYIKIDDHDGKDLILREVNNKKELLIPIKNKLIYSILF